MNASEIYRKLSPYTLAKNCSDKQDIRDGIQEIREAISIIESNGKAFSTVWYKMQNRWNKLNDKLCSLK